MLDNEKKIVVDVLDYLGKQLVNEIDNHGGLQEPETSRLATAIQNAVKNSKEHFSR